MTKTTNNKRLIKVITLFLCVVMILGSVLSYRINSSAKELYNEELELNAESCLSNDDNQIFDIDYISNDENGLKIAIMNDFHYFSKELYSDCEEFNYDCKAEKKLLLESDAILNEAIEEVKKGKPDVILVGGDMTKDGELINHQKVIEKLKLMKEELHNSGVNTQIYVTNGNHDINSNARDYSSGETVHIPSVTASEFRELYKDFGYGEGSEFYSTAENVGGGLSYATDLGKGFTLIVVDTNKYTPDQTKTGTAVAEVGGMISDDLLKWIQAKAKEAYDKGNKPIVLQHHAITRHFVGQEFLGKNFIIDNSEKICNAYADAKINIVFSGHSHASDIAEAEIDNPNKVYDVMTSSLVGYPVTTRTVNLANKDDKLSFNTSVHFYDQIDYIDEETGTNISNVQEYAYEKGLGISATETLMSDDTVDYILELYKNRGGTKAALAKTLNVAEENVTDEIVNMVVNKLPTDEDNGIDVSLSKFKFKLFYDEAKDSIYLKQKTKKGDNSKLAVDLYVPISELKNFIEDMYKNVDENILNNPEDVSAVFRKIVNEVFTHKLNGKYTAYEYYVFGYDYYKTGFKCPKDLIDSYSGRLKESNKYAKKFIKTLFYTSCKKEMVKLLESNELNLDKLIRVGNDNLTSKCVVKIITMLFKDLGDVWTKVGKRVLLSDKVVNMTNDYMIYLIEGLAVDNNVPDDNEFSLEIGN